jgi:transposase-like protein
VRDHGLAGLQPEPGAVEVDRDLVWLEGDEAGDTPDLRPGVLVRPRCLARVPDVVVAGQALVGTERLASGRGQRGLVDVGPRDVPAGREPGLLQGQRPGGVGEDAVGAADDEATAGLADVDAVVATARDMLEEMGLEAFAERPAVNYGLRARPRARAPGKRRRGCAAARPPMYLASMSRRWPATCQRSWVTMTLEGAVRLVREMGKPIAQVARDLGINEGTLGNLGNLGNDGRSRFGSPQRSPWPAILNRGVLRARRPRSRAGACRGRGWQDRRRAPRPGLRRWRVRRRPAPGRVRS